jgi:hypothetical protein
VAATTSIPTPANDALAAIVQAALTPIVAPLIAEIAASRQTNERQAIQLVEQAETIGRLRTELERIGSGLTAVTDERDALRAQVTRHERQEAPNLDALPLDEITSSGVWWGRWWWIVTALVLALTAVFLPVLR